VRIHGPSTGRLLVAATLMVCSQRASAQKYVAPSRDNIVSTTEERTDNPPVHLIFVENHSTASVTVFNVSLSGCTNVKDPCWPKQVNIRVAPGQRQIVMRVSPRNPEQGFGYHFGFSWHADASAMQALEGLAEGVGSKVPEVPAATQQPNAESARAPAVAAAPDPHAPVFAGIALDAESQLPLACTRVALEDSLQNVVARSRTTRDGVFYLNPPSPGTYRVRVETFGWSPVYGPFTPAASDETKEQKYLVKFVEQMLISRHDLGLDAFEHARPAAVSTALYGPPQRGAASTPVVQGVTLGGSESMPILGIVGRAPAGTSWVQFVVDSLGRVDTTSVQLPAGTDKLSLASVKSVLPRVRFTPARESGAATCEMLRMQVNFSPR